MGAGLKIEKEGKESPQQKIGFAKCLNVMKKHLHPVWFSETKVFCDGVLIMVTESTSETLTVDTWSGNHPAYKNQDFLAPQKNPNLQGFLNKTKKSSF